MSLTTQEHLPPNMPKSLAVKLPDGAGPRKCHRSYDNVAKGIFRRDISKISELLRRRHSVTPRENSVNLVPSRPRPLACWQTIARVVLFYFQIINFFVGFGIPSLSLSQLQKRIAASQDNYCGVSGSFKSLTKST